MRLVVRLAPGCCLFSVALFTLFVGLTSTVAIDRASAQARTTTSTTFNCTAPSPPCGTTVTTTALGANTGGIAADAATSAVQTDIEEIRKRRTADPDTQPTCGPKQHQWAEPVGTVQWERYRKRIEDMGRSAGFDITRSLSSGGSLTYGFLGGDS